MLSREDHKGKCALVVVGQAAVQTFLHDLVMTQIRLVSEIVSAHVVMALVT